LDDLALLSGIIALQGMNDLLITWTYSNCWDAGRIAAEAPLGFAKADG